MVRLSSDGGLTLETELLVYIWKLEDHAMAVLFVSKCMYVISKDTSEFLKDHVSRIIMKVKVSVGSRLTFSISVSSRRV